MMDLGELVLKVTAKTEGAEAKIEKLAGQTDQMSNKQKGLNKVASMARKAFVAYGAACVAVYAALKKTLGVIASEGDEIDKQSQKLHVSAEQYQALGLAAEHCGTSISTFTRANTQAMNKGYDNVYSFLEELEKLPNSADRAAKAQEVLGTKTANELAPLIEGTQSISDYREELERLGYYSDEAVKNSAAYEDALTSLNQSMVFIKSIIAEEVLPVATKLINKVTDFISKNRDKISAFFGAIATGMAFIIAHAKVIGGVLAGLGATSIITTVISGVMGIISTIKTLMPILSALKVSFLALSANPFVLVIAGIVAVIAAIVLLIKNWDKVKKVFKKALSIAVKIPAVQIAIAKLKLLRAGWELIKKAVKKAVSFAVKIPGVQKAIDSFKTLKGWWDKIKKGGTATYKTNKTGNATGHRIGLAEVPYDNYAALLHKGETVLTAAETNQLTSLINGMGNGSASMGAQLTPTASSQATFIMNLDGKTIGQSTVNYVNGQTLQFNCSPLI